MKTAFDRQGNLDAPALVLIHGLGMNRQITWDGLLPYLIDDFQIIRYDLLGHGESALPDSPPNLDSLAQQLNELLDRLAIHKAILCGFSLGGMINRQFAIRHPEKTLGLVILNSPHERTQEAQENAEAMALANNNQGPSATIDAALARWFSPDAFSDQPELVAKVRQIILANHAENYARHRYVLANGVRQLIRPIPPITVPTLVMTCENDTGSSPAMSHAIANEISGAQLNIIPHLQHLGLVENPQAFAPKLIRFLHRLADN